MTLYIPPLSILGCSILLIFNYMNEEKYKLEVRCKNCNFDGTVELKKGMKVEDSLCPECSCKTLIKKMRPIRIVPDIPNYR